LHRVRLLAFSLTRPVAGVLLVLLSTGLLLSAGSAFQSAANSSVQSQPLVDAELQLSPAAQTDYANKMTVYRAFVDDMVAGSQALPLGVAAAFCALLLLPSAVRVGGRLLLVEAVALFAAYGVMVMHEISLKWAVPAAVAALVAWLPPTYWGSFAFPLYASGCLCLLASMLAGRRGLKRSVALTVVVAASMVLVLEFGLLALRGEYMYYGGIADHVTNFAVWKLGGAYVLSNETVMVGALAALAGSAFYLSPLRRRGSGRSPAG
jgi:hypothetical protein